jgi:hypothetical protein
MTPANASADFEEAMRDLAVGEAGQPWREGWADSQRSFPGEGPIFLRPRWVRDVCRELGLSADIRQAVTDALAMFEGRPALRRLAWHCHVRLFGCAEPQIVPLRKVEVPWPTRPEDLPEWGEMFHAVVLLSGGRFMRELHRRRGIKAEITRDTAGDLELWMRHYRSVHGRWGLAQTPWLANHFLGRIFKLGRLQFRFEEFPYDFRAFRRRDGRRVVLLAPGAARFRADGQFDGAGGVYDTEHAWTSVFRDDGRTARGHPVSPDGRALPEPIDLPADRWRPILQKGDPVLGVHIPAAGPMTHKACGESFRRAVSFFSRHFPEYAYKAFNCTSWFLDEQFGRLLPASSNIRRFQEEVYLYPLPRASDDQTFERVFGRRFADIAEAPRDTALRRTIAQHVAAGGHFHAGGMLLFGEDLDWGRKIYRTMDTTERGDG